MPNVIITGLPRSGTSLSCYLLNQCVDTVALSEPPIAAMDTPTGTDHTHISAGIRHYFVQTRHTLLTEGSALSHQINGAIPDNYAAAQSDDRGIRPMLARVDQVQFNKPLTADFTLCIKHPAPFTALLAELNRHFNCYAIIRNPLAVLASWNSVKVPIGQRGHIPAAERLDAHLTATLAGIADKLDRQLYLLDWFFRQYATLLPPARILRYEAMIADPGAILSAITPQAAGLSMVLQNRNSSYSPDLLQSLTERLLASEGFYWRFYSPDTVKTLLTQLVD